MCKDIYDRSDDMEMGYISTIIVKHSSRFGRNYLEVGQYTDYYFPEHNIRFIAINNCIDSENGEDDFSAFRNVMNEMHSITERDAFSYGFQLGVQLMAEAFLLPLGEEEQ